MTSFGYIIMIIVDSGMFLFHFDCVMKLTKSYHIATIVGSRKSATTFGDILDCLRLKVHFRVPVVQRDNGSPDLDTTIFTVRAQGSKALQGSWGQHGAHLGPTGPRWAPCWPYKPCYICRQVSTKARCLSMILCNVVRPGDVIQSGESRPYAAVILNA